MKQLTYIILAVLINIPFGYSQLRKKGGLEKNISLPFNSDIVSINVVKDKFFVVKTAAQYIRKSKYNAIHYISADFKTSWSKPIEGKFMQSIVVASEFTPYIYHIESRGGIGVDNNVVRFDGDGNQEKFLLNSKFEFKRSERKIAYFSTSHKLCMLSVSDYETTRKVSATINKKKTNVTLAKSYLVLHTINHKDKKLVAKKIKTSFESRISDAPVHFELLGQEDSIFYILRKERGKIPSKMDLSVLVLNEMGDIKETWKWEVDAKNDLLPIFNIREGNGAFIANKDYDKEVSTSGNASGGTTTTTITTISAGSYGSSFVDLENDEFYFLSFTSDIKSPIYSDFRLTYKPLKQTCKEVRVQKFQFSTGELLEEMELKLPTEIKKDPHWASVKTMGVHFVDMGDKNFKVSLIGLKAAYVLFFNMQKKEFNYVVKDVEGNIKNRDLNVKYEHKVFQTNLILSKAYSKPEFLKYLNNFPSWREKNYSINGIDLGTKIVVIKNGAYSARNSTANFKVFSK